MKVKENETKSIPYTICKAIVQKFRRSEPLFDHRRFPREWRRQLRRKDLEYFHLFNINIIAIGITNVAEKEQSVCHVSGNLIISNFQFLLFEAKYLLCSLISCKSFHNFFFKLLIKKNIILLTYLNMSPKS